MTRDAHQCPIDVNCRRKDYVLVTLVCEDLVESIEVRYTNFMALIFVGHISSIYESVLRFVNQAILQQNEAHLVWKSGYDLGHLCTSRAFSYQAPRQTYAASEIYLPRL